MLIILKYAVLYPVGKKREKRWTHGAVHHHKFKETVSTVQYSGQVLSIDKESSNSQKHAH